jgi:hypothetical protein
MKAWVKMVQSILYLHKCISKMRFTAFCTHHGTFSTHHCAHFSENYET